MLAALFFCFALVSFAQPDAQGRPPGQQPAATPQAGASPSASPSGQQRGAQERPSPSPEEPPVVTKHEIRVGGRTLRYTATTGMMPIKNRDGDTEARLFFMAYTLDDAGNRARRPLTFSFNGGPGSSSVWLHLGTVGPKRVRMNSDGGMPAPPFELVDNEHTWLTQSDLVFIDPVGTGYSRAARPDLNAKFLGLQGDIESVGEFIRLYLTRYERWASPLFLVGESYGTTRASALSGYLIDRGIAFNGIMLVSAIMNFQTTRFAPGNDLPYALFLPSYAATAWYHKRLPADLQSRSLKEVVAEVEPWASNEYTMALERGGRLPPQQRQEVVAKLSRYTGLSPTFYDNANLRVDLSLFRKELLRSERRSVGRLDSRFKGYDSNYSSDSPDYDPSEAAIRAPYTSTFNNYVRRDLGYKTDLEYYILGGGFTSPWNWGTNNTYVDTSVALRNALAKNPYLKIFVACGYYDMATPFYAAEYTIHHVSIDPSLLRNFSTGYYEAGHMMYIDEKSREAARGHRKVHSGFTEQIGDETMRMAAALFCVLMLGGSVLPQPRIVTAAQANGTYRLRSNEIKILALGNNKLKIQMQLSYEYQSAAGPMANVGEAFGEATIENDVATFRPPDTEGCTITIKFLPGNRIKVSEDRTINCGFGLNVTSQGIYRKVRAGKPKFDVLE